MHVHVHCAGICQFTIGQVAAANDFGAFTLAEATTPQDGMMTQVMFDWEDAAVSVWRRSRSCMWRMALRKRGSPCAALPKTVRTRSSRGGTTHWRTSTGSTSSLVEWRPSLRKMPLSLPRTPPTSTPWATSLHLPLSRRLAAVLYAVCERTTCVYNWTNSSLTYDDDTMTSSASFTCPYALLARGVQREQRRR